jgi:hypothetical protein
VSTGDLYVNRYRNQLVTYTPYTYLNKKTSAKASIPLQYNTCQTMELTYNKLSSGLVREYADHIDFYLNNFRSDTTTVRRDSIVLTGVTVQPSYKLTKHASFNASVIAKYDAEAQTYTIAVSHLGPLDLTVNCQGEADRSAATDAIVTGHLPMPKQPEDYVGPVIIEAEDMDYKSIKGMSLTNAGFYYPDVHDFSGNGWADMGNNTAGSLRHQLTLKQGGEYTITVRYTNTAKSGQLKTITNGKVVNIAIEKTATNEWRKATFNATLVEGRNNLILTNTAGIAMYIDQVIYSPADTPTEKFLLTIRSAEHGTVVADVEEAAEGQVVTLTPQPDAGCQLKELRIVNSVYYSMAKTIAVGNGTGKITFTMPDDNVTIQPVFADMTVNYKLDFTNVLSGTLPPGWRCVQDNNEVHDYPNSYTSGSRTFQGFTGYQGKALYWRNNCAEYGRQASYPLTLDAGNYKLTYAMAAWKGSPKYNVQIVNLNGGASVASSQTYTATPNVDGSTTGNVSSAQLRELPFTVSQPGNYVIRFVDQTGTGGYHEFLLLECRVNNIPTSDINPAMATRQLPVGIYSPDGRQLTSLHRGLNIVVDANGHSRKVLVK